VGQHHRRAVPLITPEGRHPTHCRLLPDQVQRRPSFSENELANCAKDTAGIIGNDVVAAVF
jgi:hypothetical protein